MNWFWSTCKLEPFHWIGTGHMDVWTPYYGQSCCPTTQIQKCLRQGRVANLCWLSVWKMVLLCIRLLGHITHTVTGFSSCLMHSPATLLLASLALQSTIRMLCNPKPNVSDPIHRPVTTHALTKEETSLPLKETLLSSKMDRSLNESCWGWVEFNETLS